MKKVIFLMSLAIVLLTACTSTKQGIHEVELDEVNKRVQEYIENIAVTQTEKDTGIYMFTDKNNQRYLYLNQDFLSDGKDFGDANIQVNDETFSIYLNDVPSAGEESKSYKLYKINVKGNYEYMRVYKNNVETHFANIGY